MQLRKTLYMMSGTLRSVFFAFLILLIISMGVYIHNLVSKLRGEARTIVEFYAMTIQRIASDPMQPEALTWFFENIIQATNFPLILTDSDKNPSSWKGIGIPDTSHSPELDKEIRHIMKNLARENEPVPITYIDTESGQEHIINYLFYGDSKMIARLSFFPYVIGGGFFLLVLVAFFGVNSIRQSEQRFIWVGMAKETAHQLGTPISSLLGWTELLKAKDDEKIVTIANDMSTDIKRLEKVAARFSQIGSKPVLQDYDVYDLTKNLFVYFDRRLPNNGHSVKLQNKLPEKFILKINKDLFEWTLENLVKNAVDAIKGKSGSITINGGQVDNHYYIDVIDTGIGLSPQDRNKIFKAGYSTKKRGWGLGLNLAKRIIEEYHNGKLFVKDSQQGKGTTMRILL